MVGGPEDIGGLEEFLSGDAPSKVKELVWFVEDLISIDPQYGLLETELESMESELSETLENNSNREILLGYFKKKLLRGLRNSGIDDDILKAMEKVRREDFALQTPVEIVFTYIDTPRPYKCEQTISQPTMYVLMYQVVGLRPGMRALEIGTGSAYGTELLRLMGLVVCTIENRSELAEEAKERFKDYANVHVKYGDGREGWPQHFQYDAIIVTAATDGFSEDLIEQSKEESGIDGLSETKIEKLVSEEDTRIRSFYRKLGKKIKRGNIITRLPEAWVGQLKEGGRIIVPINTGIPDNQILTLLEKENGVLEEKYLTPVRFVQLTEGLY